MKFEKDFLRSTDLGLLLLRIALGGLMLFHGMHKLIYGVGFIGDMLAAIGLPSFIAYGSLLAELVASLMIICGIWTRLASVVFAGNMVVAILMAHASEMFSLSPMTGGLVIELPLLYLLGAAVLCLTGGGRFAVTKGTVLD
ncbi:DoxX family protein [Marseilla massiliensis]|jgi:putative oxidoreductase|uniref:DoxX family protein n=1 Tax=Marseilla massiliensis TaxID=1841864 RepID=UPI001F860AD2|nr:DoxX family protein [Marseilla massiliensis]MCL1610571.1 DoxX family protein [Marseilla massiliensis]MEE0361328.1 DoxX family protein [Prevotella sp.]HIV83900.1 DoxX family protein [Candidatus Prevotella intestinigallinarum]